MLRSLPHAAERMTFRAIGLALDQIASHGVK